MSVFASVNEALELSARTFSDSLPMSNVRPRLFVGLLYVFSETSDNIWSPIRAASQQVSQGMVGTVGAMDLEDAPGYPGFSEVRKQFSWENVNNVIPVRIPDGAQPHTHTEAIGLVRLARRMSYPAVAVTAAPFHLVRAFVEVITATVREYPALRVYCVPGAPVGWTESVVHSQGTLMIRAPHSSAMSSNVWSDIMRKATLCQPPKRSSTSTSGINNIPKYFTETASRFLGVFLYNS